MPLVTIIVPVFNREATISDSLTSIIEQTFQDWKLVVVDDNSTDRSAEIIDSFIERDSRIQSKKNIEYSHSAAGARLSGLLELDTPFVAFLDSDDCWPSYHLQTCINYLNQFNEIDFIFGNIQRYRGNQLIGKSKFDDEIKIFEIFKIDWMDDNFGVINDDNLLKKSLINRFVPGLHTSVFRSEVFRQVTLDDKLKVGEDFLFNLECIHHGFKLGVSRKIHLHYRVHENNISNSNNIGDALKSLKIWQDEVFILGHAIERKVKLTSDQKIALNNRLADTLMWHLSACHEQLGDYKNAFKTKSKAVALNPLNLKFYKSTIGLFFRYVYHYAK